MDVPALPISAAGTERSAAKESSSNECNESPREVDIAELLNLEADFPPAEFQPTSIARNQRPFYSNTAAPQRSRQPPARTDLQPIIVSSRYEQMIDKLPATKVTSTPQTTATSAQSFEELLEICSEQAASPMIVPVDPRRMSSSHTPPIVSGLMSPLQNPPNLSYRGPFFPPKQ